MVFTGFDVKTSELFDQRTTRFGGCIRQKQMRNVLGGNPSRHLGSSRYGFTGLVENTI
jgi:hypothetical protein